MGNIITIWFEMLKPVSLTGAQNAYKSSATQM